jgi:hypothetical protein
LREQNRHPTILLDSPLDPKVAFELFGRWRDEVFAIPATWVVVAHQDRLAQYLTPPADVFFDVVVRLEPLSREQALEILSRRDTHTMLPADVRESIVESFDGTPRHLLRLARQHATAGGATIWKRRELTRRPLRTSAAALTCCSPRCKVAGLLPPQMKRCATA